MSPSTVMSQEDDVRAMFVAYLTFVVAGLTYLFVIGFLSR